MRIHMEFSTIFSVFYIDKSVSFIEQNALNPFHELLCLYMFTTEKIPINWSCWEFKPIDKQKSFLNIYKSFWNASDEYLNRKLIFLYIYFVERFYSYRFSHSSVECGTNSVFSSKIESKKEIVCKSQMQLFSVENLEIERMQVFIFNETESIDIRLY